MIVKVLIENTSENDLFHAEHGLSLYIETEKHKILFDMGQSSSFAKNAITMGIDLSDIDIALLSHGHYDHGGGLKRFLELNTKASIYLSRYAFEPYYDSVEKYIGLDINLKNSNRLVFTDDILELDDTLTLCSCNQMEHKFNPSRHGLNVLKDGKLIPDDFRHEQYLLIKENNKRILISGCSHKGVLNIMNQFNPDVFIGGFHFMKLETSSKILTNSAIELLSYPTKYYTCHCTGTEQYNQLKDIMSDKLNYLSTGDELAI